MHVTVDSTRCQGHARCNLICPDVFELDEMGHAVVAVSEIPAGQDDRVRQAIRNCPEGAISTS